MISFVWPCSIFIRFSPVYLVVIFCLGCSTLKPDPGESSSVKQCEVDETVSYDLMKARSAHNAWRYQEESSEFGRLIDEAKFALGPIECDNVRARILIDKANRLMDEALLDPGISLKKSGGIKIHTRDKTVVWMGGRRITTRKIDGKLLVIDDGTIGGQFAVFELDEIEKITLGPRPIRSDEAASTLLTLLLIPYLCCSNEGTGNVVLPASYKKSDKMSQEDYAIALKWYLQAADQGDDLARANLSLMYLLGRGVPRNNEAAIRWYEAAYRCGSWKCSPETMSSSDAFGLDKTIAKLGNAEAQFRLGRKYEEGSIASQNQKKAFKWYRLAAEQGHTEAQFRLGLMYFDGRGLSENVNRDYARAYMWWDISAPGYETAEESRDKVEALMTPDQLQRGQDLAKNCLASSYSNC